MAVRKKMKFNLLYIEVILLILASGCTTSRRDNEAYLKSIADIVIEYQSKKGNLPENIDEALEYTNRMLGHRGDVNGNPIFYYRIDDRAFFIRSIGSDRHDDQGKLDDVQVNFIDGKAVKREVLIEYVKNNYPDTWAARSIMLGD